MDVERLDERLNAGRLLAGLLEIVDGGSALAMQFERLARDMGVQPGAPTIVFLTGIKRILQKLPDKAYADNSMRLSIDRAVQDALDQAIEAEEDMEEETGHHQEGGR